MYKLFRKFRKTRKGFSMLESIASAIILSIIIIGVLSVKRTVQAENIRARESLYMSMHQLSVMEELKQMSGRSRLLAYYGPSEFSTLEFETTVNVTESSIGDFLVYYVELNTYNEDKSEHMRNTFTMTNIGSTQREDSLDDL